MDSQLIHIEKIIVHILDNESQVPIFSEKEHPLDEDIKEFIVKHINKAINDNSIKRAHFNNSSYVKDILSQLNNENFIEKSIELSKIIYKLMLQNPNIPSSDMVIVLFSINNNRYLGIFKFNYKTSYIHYVFNDEDKYINKIVKQKTTLPNENQKVDEFAIIDLNDFNIKLIEKKYEINQEKNYYFSNLFLDSTCDISDKEKVKKINKATFDFNKKYFDNDFINSSNLNNSIKECIDKKEVIDIEFIADKAFDKNIELKKIFKEHLEEYGINKSFKLNNKDYVEKVYNKQKIKTEDGIEIKLPREYFNDKSKLEFINNPDGTISIIIKNIRGIDKV